MNDDPTVFIVDNDPAIRDSLSGLVEAAGFAARAFTSAREFLTGYDGSRPACLILDLQMRGMSGLDLQDELHARNIVIPVIILTGHGNIPAAVRAVKSGAVEFLCKPFIGKELLGLVRSSVAADREAIGHEAERAKVRTNLDRLTPRERQVLDGILAGKRRGAIAADLGISKKTVEVHRSHVLLKMGASSVVELARQVLPMSAE